MHALRITLISVLMGVIVLGFAFASIPYSEVIRWMISVAVWIAGTVVLSAVARSLLSTPVDLRPMTVAALSGWTLACIAVTTLISFWRALDLMIHDAYRTPEEWIWCRAIIGGFVLATIPTVIVFWLSGRSRRSFL